MRIHAKIVHLPSLGKRVVTEEKNGHYLWLSILGWHDCTSEEDLICQKTK